MRPHISICILTNSETLSQSLKQLLDQRTVDTLQSYRYTVTNFKSVIDFSHFLMEENQQVDCLILEAGPSAIDVIQYLREQSIFLPTVVIVPEQPQAPVTDPYHEAMVQLSTSHLNQVADYIDRAIAQFLQLSPTANDPIPNPVKDSLLQQQRQLAEKLKERLGYLGVYYKRDPRNFLRHLPVDEQHKLLNQLKQAYREIVLTYFSEANSVLNQKIDALVNTAFFADVSVSRLMEIHMDLMDEFSKQLKLEGRSEEVLLDYRLTLIDIIAHLCEMYRRSIPRES
ncbi:MAG: circadian clock protein KaiA [Cyanobacteria bacterium]|nr:circadian clock protein KaiA [Cyanobacteriota bacterium]